MNDKLLIYHHLGLGDHITLSPLVRHLASQTGTVYVMVKEWYARNVEFLYRDIPNIKLQKCTGDGQAHAIFNAWHEPKLMHMYQRDWINEDENKFFEDGWYTSLGYEPSFRKETFKFERDEEREQAAYDALVKDENFIFVHDDPSRGYHIHPDFDGQIIRSDDHPEFLVFDFMKILEEAQERHVMYSSFFAILETMDTPCFLHETKTNKGGGIHPNRVKEFSDRGIIVV